MSASAGNFVLPRRRPVDAIIRPAGWTGESLRLFTDPSRQQPSALTAENEKSDHYKRRHCA